TEEGQRLLDAASQDDQKDSDFCSIQAIFHALAGNREAAEHCIASETKMNKHLGHYHHAMCYIASARAIMGDADSAIEGLRGAAEDGFPCYPWFERDPCLESVRNDPRFTQFIGKLKKQWN